MAIAVIVTIPQEKAEELAKTLLEKKVCACVNILNGVQSHFLWKGKLDFAEEAMMVIKTKETLFPKLKAFIKENHPYDVPEIIGFDITHIDEDYQDWMYKEANDQSFFE